MATTQKPRQKHVPVRTCIACRQPQGKRQLVRIVRTPTGEVRVDPTGKQAGRGAYLCPTRGCWESALAGQRLQAALKTTLTPESLAALRAYAAGLPAAEASDAVS